MELVELTIDKRNGNVCYNDKYHIYWDAGDLFTYISTTILISKFENFDRNFWLGYKAIQSLIGDSEKAKRMLVNVRRLKTIDVKEIMSIFPVFTEEQYRQKVNELSAQWKANADKACEFGTATHASYENMFDGKGWYKLDWYGYASNKHFAYIPGFYSIDDRLDRQVFPEMLISFKSRSGIRIAGQADICIKDCDTIQIQDYKTNRAINMESYRNADGSYQMMKYPLDNLMDCNSVHYQLQTSLYTWILLRKYPNLNPKDPVIIHFYDKENTKKANKYMFRYIPEAVIMMLRYFRDNIDYNYQKVIKKDGKYFITRDT